MSSDLFGAMSISASGMSAQRLRMEAIAKNLANADATRSADGEVYQRKRVSITASEAGQNDPGRRHSSRITLTRTAPGHIPAAGLRQAPEKSLPVVTAKEVTSESDAFIYVYEPHHPDADEKGYIKMPDIDTMTEMVDMVAATRAYEANLAAMKAYQNMVNKSLDI